MASVRYKVASVDVRRNRTVDHVVAGSAAPREPKVKKTLVIQAGVAPEKITVSITVENSGDGRLGNGIGAVLRGAVSYETKALQDELDMKAKQRWVTERTHTVCSALMAVLALQGGAGDISRMKVTEER